MKTKYVFRILFAMCLNLFFVDGLLFAQPLLQYNNGTNWYAQTDPAQPIESLGIGDFNGYSTTPQAALHIVVPFLPAFGNTTLSYNSSEAFRTEVDETNEHFWRMYTYSSSGSLEKFHIRNSMGTGSTVSNDIYLSVTSHDGTGYRDGFMMFETPDFHQTLRERMRIEDGLGGDNHGGESNTDNVTKISINHDGIGNYYLAPKIAMLNIGSTDPYSRTHQCGNRPWMDVGTYFNYGSDNLYVGLKDEGDETNSNYKDAVINWGDDLDNAPDLDYQSLRFIFTGWQLSSSSDPYSFNKNDGLEVARMDGHGNMGIGATFSPTLIPKRRLDIFDDGTDHNFDRYHGGPQLRLTQQLNGALLGGRWTDFQTTNKGNLFIEPHDDNVTNKDMGVGIHASDPQATLEVFRGAHTPFNAQLRLSYDIATLTATNTDLTTTSAGDLYIHPTITASGSTLLGKVGINVSSPITTLDVQGASTATGAITSGHLANTSHTLPSSGWHIVYSNSSGTLKNLPSATSATDVLHGDGNWGPEPGAGNITACSTATANWLPRYTSSTTICNSEIYDDYANHVAVGYSSVPTLSNRLDVNGNITVPYAFGYDISNRMFLNSGTTYGNTDINLGFDVGPVGIKNHPLFKSEDDYSYRTVGELYGLIAHGFENIKEKVLFIGNPESQITSEEIDFREIVKVSDRKSALAAIAMITHQGIEYFDYIENNP